MFVPSIESKGKESRKTGQENIGIRSLRRVTMTDLGELYMEEKRMNLTTLLEGLQESRTIESKDIMGCDYELNRTMICLDYNQETNFGDLYIPSHSLVLIGRGKISSRSSSVWDGPTFEYYFDIKP